MLYSQVIAIMMESNCSPEEFGELIGISGMTLRRWLKKPKKSEMPKLYTPAIREVCYQLIAQGKLNATSAAVQVALAQTGVHQQEAALRNLGLSAAFPLDGTCRDQVLIGLNQIGSSLEKKQQVLSKQKEIFSFRRFSKEWASRVSSLWAVTQSTKLRSIDKLVAFGALFYLITPIDFIPDQIPIIGLVDDFAVLGMAVAYYSRKLTRV